MTAERTRYVTGTYKTYFHDQSPFWVGFAKKDDAQVAAAISRGQPDSGDRPETGQSHRAPDWRRPEYQYRTGIRAASLPIRQRGHPPRPPRHARYNAASHRAAPHRRRHGRGSA